MNVKRYNDIDVSWWWILTFGPLTDSIQKGKKCNVAHKGMIDRMIQMILSVLTPSSSSVELLSLLIYLPEHCRKTSTLWTDAQVQSFNTTEVLAINANVIRKMEKQKKWHEILWYTILYNVVMVHCIEAILHCFLSIKWSVYVTWLLHSCAKETAFNLRDHSY